MRQNFRIPGRLILLIENYAADPTPRELRE